MLEALILLTGLAIIGISLMGLKRSKDPLFPLTILAPMLLYIYVYMPLTRLSSGAVDSIFPDADKLIVVHVINLLTVTAFCLGCISQRRPRGIDRRFELFRSRMAKRTQNRLFSLAIILGLASCSAFGYMIVYSGGWTRVFSNSKPFLNSPSGYVGELPMLSYPAAFLLAVAFQGKRLTFIRLTLMHAVLAPQIVMATFGGRRGPTFLVACTLVGCWCIIRGRLPKVKWVVTGLATMGVFMLLLGENRSNLFRPWSSDVDVDIVSTVLGPSSVSLGDEYVTASGTILASMHHDRHYWGARYFTIFLVRPIPKQLWPTKYSDLGMGWMETDAGRSGMTTSEWFDAIGFETATGAAPGMVADLFLEFSWGCILACFLLGRVFSIVWKKWVQRGGIWTIFYFEMLILSVFLVTQGLGAWMYRLILVGVMTYVLGGRNLAKGRRNQRGVQQMPSLSPTPQPIHRRHVGSSSSRQ